MSSNTDLVSPGTMRGFAATAMLAALLWALMIWAGLALL